MQVVSLAIPALSWLIWLMISRIALSASVPYFEDFESYPVGDVAVANFNELPVTSSDVWTVVDGSYLGKAYETRISLLSQGSATFRRTAALIDFPELTSSAFTMSTKFRVDVAGAPAGSTAIFGLAARGTNFAEGERYQIAYILEGNIDRPTGRLWLRETNFSQLNDLNRFSSAALPVVPGNVYSLAFSGMPSGGSMAFQARLTDLGSGESISVQAIDDADIVSGSYFGYVSAAEVVINGSSFLNVDADNFLVAVPEPGTVTLFSACVFAVFLRRR